MRSFAFTCICLWRLMTFPGKFFFALSSDTLTLFCNYRCANSYRSTPWIRSFSLSLWSTFNEGCRLSCVFLFTFTACYNSFQSLNNISFVATSIASCHNRSIIFLVCMIFLCWSSFLLTPPVPFSPVMIETLAMLHCCRGRRLSFLFAF